MSPPTSPTPPLEIPAPTALLEHHRDDRHEIVTFPRVIAELEALEDVEAKDFFRGRLQHVLDHVFVLLGGLSFLPDLL
jgi:hypothetical protein